MTAAEIAQYIVSDDPAILYGKPVIRGTRIAVDLILEKLSAGVTIPHLLEAYPHLKEEQILACLAYEKAEKWRMLFQKLPDIPEISMAEIVAEVKAVREQRKH